MSRSGIMWLMYHEIELPNRSTCHTEAGYRRYVVSAAEFRQQMHSLKEDGWHGMSTSEALAQPKLPGVALTFDDGCETDFIEAAPLLRELGFNATFYITVGCLGSPGFLSREQLRQLGDLGFEIGCHSWTHAYLPDLNHDDLRKELVLAKQEIEQIAGRPVEHFSCPGGRWDRRVLDAAQNAGYRSVAGSRPRTNAPDADPYELGRVAILRGIALPTFRGWAAGKNLWKMRVADSARIAAQHALGNSFYDRFRTLLLER
jgi:peptidoglycan/xylan/chitin deacetylase (PgdA/CDA1 family)